MLTRRTVILVGREAIYGTDPVLTGANGILAWDVEPGPQGDLLERDIMRDTLSPLPHVIGKKWTTLNFKAEIKGAGLTGTLPDIPNWATALSACGFDTGAYSGTALELSLVSDEAVMNSVSFYVYKDGNMHKITGARGTVRAVMNAGEFGVFEFEFQGLFNPVVAATLPDLTGLDNELPPIVYFASFQIAGFSPVASRAQIDMQNEIAQRADLNATNGVDSFRITNRNGKLEFDADAVVEASNPFWGDWSGDVVDTYSIQIGQENGNKVAFNGNFQLDSINYADAEGVSQYECVAALVSSDANSIDDEVKITVT